MRRRFDHLLPSWIDPDATFFITINAAQRGVNQLCQPEIGKAIFTAVQRYQADQRWFCELVLLMPDHLHMIVSMSRDHRLATTMGLWKQWLSRKHKIRWQENFFDHRLRHDESGEEKIRYIKENPVRAGLVRQAGDWPWVLSPE